jgi:transposase-like protein
MDTSRTGTGRRRLTSKQRQRLLAKFHQSQLAQREFANQHAIGMSTLSKWLRLERNAIAEWVKAKAKHQAVAPTA